MKSLYKNVILGLLVSGCLFSCNTNDLAKEFNCQNEISANLEEVTDFKKNFSFDLPKHWKTNLYYDDAVSSIYAADTTVNLTSSVIIDASFILNSVNIDNTFIEKIAKENKEMGLSSLQSKKIKFHKKEAYYDYAKGKRGNFTYHILNLFAKTNNGFLHVKTELYGDDSVNERLCKAVKLIDQIHLK